MMDKTGLLMNKPSVSNVWIEGQIFSADELCIKINVFPRTEPETNDEKNECSTIPRTFYSMLSAIALCSKPPQSTPADMLRKTSIANFCRRSYLRLRRASLNVAPIYDTRKNSTSTALDLLEFVTNPKKSSVTFSGITASNVQRPTILELKINPPNEANLGLENGTKKATLVTKSLVHHEGLGHSPIAKAFEQQMTPNRGGGDLCRIFVSKRGALSTALPVDSALLEFVEKFAPTKMLRDEFEIIYEMPFSLNQRCQLVVVRSKCLGREKESRKSIAGDGAEDCYQLIVRGAPEEIIQSCTKIVTSKGTVVIDDERLVEFEVNFFKFIFNAFKIF